MFMEIISDMDLNGFNLIPLVQEIICEPSSIIGLIRSIIVSKITLGVAINTNDELFITSSNFSEASIFGDNCNSGW